MARQYSLKSFLRQAPNTLLQRYLALRGVATDLPWNALKESDVDLVLRVINGSPESVRREVEADFRDVYRVADEGGAKTIIEEGRHPHHGVELAEVLGGMGSHMERALWAFLEHPRVFEVARRFHYADSLTRWRKRVDLPPAEAATDAETADRLGKAISDYYREKEGRGHACQVDHYSRVSRLYWFVYPADYATGTLVFTDDSKLENQTQRPAFEVIFVYSAEEGSLDTWGRGDKETLQHLQGMFASIVLGVELGLGKPKGPVYSLGGLLDRDFPLPLEPEDGVEEVCVRRLRLRVQGGGSRRVTLEADTRGDPSAVYRLLDDVLAGRRLTREQLQVASVSFGLVFSDDGPRGPRRLVFDVSHPDSCSLRHEPSHDVAKALLKRWGIDVSGCSGDGTPGSGSGPQHTLRV